jgi:hypothetical protein
MKNVLLMIGAIVLIAGAAVGGYFYGVSQAPGDSTEAGFDMSQMGSTQFQRGQFDPSQMTQEQLEQLRQNRGMGQFRTGQGAAEGGAELFGGGAMGTIDSIEDGVITVRTSDAAVQITTTDTTLIEKLMPVTVNDLQVGEQVVVSGSQNDDGTTTARSIRVMTGPGL